MRNRGRLGPVALALGALLATGACGTADDGADGVELDVWLTQYSLGEKLVEDFVRDFESRNPGVEARVTVQEWDGIGEKVTAALAADDAIRRGGTSPSSSQFRGMRG